MSRQIQPPARRFRPRRRSATARPSQGTGSFRRRWSTAACRADIGNAAAKCAAAIDIAPQRTDDAAASDGCHPIEQRRGRPTGTARNASDDRDANADANVNANADRGAAVAEQIPRREIRRPQVRPNEIRPRNRLPTKPSATDAASAPAATTTAGRIASGHRGRDRGRSAGRRPDNRCPGGGNARLRQRHSTACDCGRRDRRQLFGNRCSRPHRQRPRPTRPPLPRPTRLPRPVRMRPQPRSSPFPPRPMRRSSSRQANRQHWSMRPRWP